MGQKKLVYGTFQNGIPYLKFGKGPHSLIILLGGPGNILPAGLGATGFTLAMKSFTENYTVYLVSRKSGLPERYTTRNMSDDYADLIREEFGGHVDLIIGFSFGGLIAQHFAADHPEMFNHIVIGGAAHKISEAAKRIDYQYAYFINRKKDRKAMAVRAEAVFAKGILKTILEIALWIFGKGLLGKTDDTFRKDVLIEAGAELAHESVDSLRRIKVSVLVVCGVDDFAFPISYVEEMVSMIPNAKLLVYGQGHSTVIFDKKFVRDVAEFTDGNII